VKVSPRETRLSRFHPDLCAAKTNAQGTNEQLTAPSRSLQRTQSSKTNALFSAQTTAPILDNSFLRAQDKDPLFLRSTLCETLIQGTSTKHICETLQ
jgi:hypothetical protein